MALDTHELGSLLQKTLGKDVTVTSVAIKKKPDWAPSARLATYKSDKKEVYLLISHKLAVTLGGSFAMIPPGGVEDEFANSEFSEIIGEGFHEISNIIVSVISLTFKDTFSLTEEPPKVSADLVKKLDNLEKMNCYTVKVGGGYEAGEFLFIESFDE